MKKMILFHGGSCCCLRQSTFGVLFGILINKNVLSRMYFFYPPTQVFLLIAAWVCRAFNYK